MTQTLTIARRAAAGYIDAWDWFWFQPRLPHTLALLRIVTGVMLLYSQLVLATDLLAFLGPDAWIDNQTARQLHDGTFGFADFGRSYLWYIDQPSLLWAHHGFTMLVTACFAAGLLTRVTAPLAWLLQLMYLHRMTGALFGFDQIVTYATMYLMLAPCGSCYSVDAALRRRWASRRQRSRLMAWLFPEAIPSVAANIATRLFQLHVCVIYLFGGLAKARGQTWWDGTAMWYSVANYEYQSIDMTWMAHYPRLFTAMTHATLFWEIFYCALIWPRRTRPWMLLGAVVLHGGIAAFMGMITFGVMMISANMIFVPPEWVRRQRHASSEWPSSAGGTVAGAAPDPNAESTGASKPGPSVLHAVEEREQDLQRREEQLRKANRKLSDRKAKLAAQEATYRDRVSRLKEREGKIKNLVERRRQTKTSEEPPQT